MDKVILTIRIFILSTVAIVFIFSVRAEDIEYPYSPFTDRDPLYPLVNERGEVLVREKREVGDIIIQGIIYSEQDSSVIINNEIFRQGDIYEAYTIKKIEPDGIIFEKDGNEYSLRWEG